MPLQVSEASPEEGNQWVAVVADTELDKVLATSAPCSNELDALGNLRQLLQDQASKKLKKNSSFADELKTARKGLNTLQ